MLNFLKKKKTKKKYTPPYNLNIGCGAMYLDNWINIDINPQVGADLCCNIMEVKDHFGQGSVDKIMLIHSISYLRLWEARDFFKSAYKLLKPGGTLILEFPDIVKCSQILSNPIDLTQYMEAIRAVYAFDLGEIKRKDAFTTYAFGWSAFHIVPELKDTGFTEINILHPLTHDQRVWRDSRVEAIKK